MGRRQRYRLVDLERLCWRLGTDNLEEVRTVLEVTLKETLARDEVKREGCWTESLAVGTPAFVEKIPRRKIHAASAAVLADARAGPFAPTILTGSRNDGLPTVSWTVGAALCHQAVISGKPSLGSSCPFSIPRVPPAWRASPFSRVTKANDPRAASRPSGKWDNSWSRCRRSECAGPFRHKSDMACQICHERPSGDEKQ